MAFRRNLYISDFGLLSWLLRKIFKGTWLATDEFCYKIRLKPTLGKTCFIFIPRRFNDFSHVIEWYFFFPPGNGFVNSRASPNLLGTTGANSLGKVMPTKSPPPPGSGSLAASSRKPELRVVIPPSGKGAMPPLVRAPFCRLARGLPVPLTCSVLPYNLDLFLMGVLLKLAFEETSVF